MSLETAKVEREESARQHGKPIYYPDQGNPSFFYYEKAFGASPDVLSRVTQLAEDPKLAEQYPNHRVFVTKELEVIAAIPKNLHTQGGQYRGERGVYDRVMTEAQMAATQRGITLFDCAMIFTGPREQTPAVME